MIAIKTSLAIFSTVSSGVLILRSDGGEPAVLQKLVPTPLVASKRDESEITRVIAKKDRAIATSASTETSIRDARVNYRSDCRAGGIATVDD